MRELRKQVTEHADYVGDRFADEARKIHYAESEPRGIYGEATTEEAKKLVDEGIEFQPLPTFFPKNATDGARRRHRRQSWGIGLALVRGMRQAAATR